MLGVAPDAEHPVAVDGHDDAAGRGADPAVRALFLLHTPSLASLTTPCPPTSRPATTRS